MHWCVNAIPYSRIARMTATLIGKTWRLDASTSDGMEIGTVEQERLQNSHSFWLGHISRGTDWPHLRRYERRPFRLAWDSATAYSATAERFHIRSQKYVQALRASTGQEPYDAAGTLNAAYWADCATEYAGTTWTSTTALTTVGTIYYYPVDGQSYALHTAAPTGTAPTNTSYFGLLTPFNPYVPATLTGYTTIGEFLRLTERDPRVSQKPGDLLYTLSNEGAQVKAPITQPWVTYRIVIPQLIGAVWDSDTTYTGGQVYFQSTSNGVTEGDFYDWIDAAAGESPATHPTKWSKVEIPVIFGPYLAHQAAADWWIAQKDTERAALNTAAAQRIYEYEVDNLNRQQQQLGRSRLVLN